jgi:hypothetical protein
MIAPQFARAVKEIGNRRPAAPHTEREGDLSYLSLC